MGTGKNKNDHSYKKTHHPHKLSSLPNHTPIQEKTDDFTEITSKLDQSSSILKESKD